VDLEKERIFASFLGFGSKIQEQRHFFLENLRRFTLTTFHTHILIVDHIEKTRVRAVGAVFVAG
jgi:hypothetical protein